MKLSFNAFAASPAEVIYAVFLKAANAPSAIRYIAQRSPLGPRRCIFSSGLFKRENCRVLHTLVAVLLVTSQALPVPQGQPS